MKKSLSKLLMFVLLMTAVCILPASYGIKASAYVEIDALVSGKDYDYYQNSDGTVTITSYNGSSSNIVIPETINGKTVVGFDHWIVSGQSNKEKVVSVTIPKTVTSIGEYAFENMPNLKTVTINGKPTRIGNYAFGGCKSLTTINFPNGLKQISANAFRDCTALKSVTLPSTLKTIDSSAFNGCTNLETITIPSSVTEFGDNCFDGTKWLTNRQKDFSSHLVIVNGVILDGTKYEGTKLTIPDYITAIGDYAFVNNKNLKSIVIPSSVKTIGAEAFKGCKNLTTISGPKELTSFGANAFEDTKWLNDLKAKNPLVIVNGVLIDGSYAEGNIVILNTVNKIGSGAFYMNKYIKTVTIPSSVKQIDNAAFCYCSALTSVKLSSGLISIGDAAFSDCSSLTSITFPSTLKTIGYCAFDYCKALNKIVIPSSVTSIGERAFESCTSATEIQLPSTPLTVGAYAFAYCSNVSSLFVPKNLKIEGDGVFYYMGISRLKLESGVTNIYALEFGMCISLVSVELPDTLVKIGRAAFVDGLSLQEINIPKKTASIMSQAFDTCPNISTLNISKNTKTIGQDAFKDCRSLVIRCTKGSAIDTYAAKNDIKVSYLSLSTSRVYGDTRYATAVSVAKTAFPKGSERVIIASGTDFADALAGVPLATMMDAPILLSGPTGLDDATLAQIKSLKAQSAFILGGTGAVPDVVEKQLNNIGVGAVRFGGANRYETAVLLAGMIVNSRRSTTVYLVNGSAYADALSASPAAAISNSPILYTKPNGTLDDSTKEFLKNMSSLKNIKVIGGTSLISKSAMNLLTGYVPSASNIERFAGNNRYLTCVAVNEANASLFTGDSICVVTGKNFPDALTAGVYAAKNKIPLFLADTTLYDKQKAYLMNKMPSKVIAVGGVGVVPDAMVTKIASAVKAGW